MYATHNNTIRHTILYHMHIQIIGVTDESQ